MSMGRRFQSLTVVGRKAEVLYCVLAGTLEPHWRELGAGERAGGRVLIFMSTAYRYALTACLSSHVNLYGDCNSSSTLLPYSVFHSSRNDPPILLATVDLISPPPSLISSLMSILH